MARGPIPDKPTARPSVADVQRLIDAFYQFKGCEVGGGLHIVLDDENWEDSHIQWCIDTAETHWSGHAEATILLGRLLLSMTRTQRAQLDSGYNGKPMPEDAFIAKAKELLENLG